MTRWIAGLAAVLLLPACGGGGSHQGRDSTGSSDDGGPGQALSVRIVTPASGATAPEHAALTIQAEVTDPKGVVDRIEFYDDNRRIGSTSDPPYVISYSPSKSGAHDLCAVAIDFDGNPTASLPVTLFVVHDDKDDGHGHDRKH